MQQNQRFAALALAALAALLTLPAQADPPWGHGRGSARAWEAPGAYPGRGHRSHGPRCDHGPVWKRRGRGYQPFYAPSYRGRAAGGHPPRRDAARRYHGHARPPVHRHRHRPVAFLAPAHRRGWRWCDRHGAWYRLGDIVFLD